jgi:Protein kinase domain/Galactose oxidase, central domain
MTERFTLLSELGRGGMGVVWKARDEETGQIVALKLLRETYAEDPDYLARFERELELAKRIDSVHVVKMLGFGVREKMPYLALEYVEGPSLQDALAKHGPYSWPETKALLIQLTQGLADANAAGVIHRDVKPANVLIGPDGVAKLTDFGISRGLDTTRMTATSTMLGTPAYLAPEGPKDARSDLYSLGIIGYQLLTGTVPFKGTSHQEVIFEHVRTAPDLGKLPPEARPIIGMLLAKDPAERPARASALLPILYGVTPAPMVGVSAAAGPVPLVAPPPVAPARPVAPAQLSAPIAYRPGGLAWSAPPPAPAWQPAPRSANRRKTLPLIPVGGALALVVCLVAGAFVAGILPPNSGILPPSSGDLSPSSGSNAGRSAAPGTFGQTGSMATARRLTTGTPLRDGRVLMVGGTVGKDGCLASAQLFDPTNGTFSPTGSMSAGRMAATSTLLSDGRVLIAGGEGLDAGDGFCFTYLASADLYNPDTGRFTPTGPMKNARSNHTATLLKDGRVLLAGGDVVGGVLAVELFDPKTGTFSTTGSLAVSRPDSTATLLPDGRVLLAGGFETSSAELYDPTTGAFGATGSMTSERYDHTATLLPNGRVLIVGGFASNAADTKGLLSAEMYEPGTGKFSATGSMATGRAEQTATLLSDGRVLVAGGCEAILSANASAEVYDPKADAFRPTGSMATARLGHVAALLPDGRVLVAGGMSPWDLASAEIYTP